MSKFLRARARALLSRTGRARPSSGHLRSRRRLKRRADEYEAPVPQTDRWAAQLGVGVAPHAQVAPFELGSPRSLERGPERRALRQFEAVLRRVARTRVASAVSMYQVNLA